jgi:hypothetical protein
MYEQTVTQRVGHHTLAIVSLALSILGLVGILPLIGSIGGIVTGVIARRQIRERPEAYNGEGMARAGIILGWVGIILGLLILFAFGLLGVAGFMGFLTSSSVQTGPPIPVENMFPVLP